MVKCANCGAKNEAGTAACRKCKKGLPLSGLAVRPSDTIPLAEPTQTWEPSRPIPAARPRRAVERVLDTTPGSPPTEPVRAARPSPGARPTSTQASLAALMLITLMGSAAGYGLWGFTRHGDDRLAGPTLVAASAPVPIFRSEPVAVPAADVPTTAALAPLQLAGTAAAQLAQTSPSEDTPATVKKTDKAPAVKRPPKPKKPAPVTKTHPEAEPVRTTEPERPVPAPEPVPPPKDTSPLAQLREEIQVCSPMNLIRRAYCTHAARMRHCSGLWGHVAECPAQSDPTRQVSAP